MNTETLKLICKSIHFSDSMKKEIGTHIKSLEAILVLLLREIKFNDDNGTVKTLIKNVILNHIFMFNDCYFKRDNSKIIFRLSGKQKMTLFMKYVQMLYRFIIAIEESFAIFMQYKFEKKYALKAIVLLHAIKWAIKFYGYYTTVKSKTIKDKYAEIRKIYQNENLNFDYAEILFFSSQLIYDILYISISDKRFSYLVCFLDLFCLIMIKRKRSVGYAGLFTFLSFILRPPVGDKVRKSINKLMDNNSVLKKLTPGIILETFESSPNSELTTYSNIED